MNTTCEEGKRPAGWDGAWPAAAGKQNVDIPELTIKIYEGTILADAKTSNAKHAGLNLDEAIAAVTGHESVHSLDQSR